jgi:polar amino acid transport system ATP-binding protein
MQRSLQPAEKGKPILSTFALSAERISKTFGRNLILDEVSLSVGRGEVVCVLGPSGSGKSTLLRCLNWLVPPESGAIWLGTERMGVEINAHGKPKPLSAKKIREQRSRIGMVFQNFNLWPHMTVLENVMEGLLSVKGLPSLTASDLAVEALRNVGLGQKLNSYPAALSGGQLQRVGIARTLAMEPEIILFDEPTSALDPELVGEVLSVMRGLAAIQTSMVVVTHEIGFAMEAADRVIFMDAGRVVEEGVPGQVLVNPASERLRQFLRRFSQEGSSSGAMLPSKSRL